MLLKGKKNKLLSKFKGAAMRVGNTSGFISRSSVGIFIADSSSSSESSSDDEAFTEPKQILAQPDLPPDFWQVKNNIISVKSSIQ